MFDVFSSYFRPLHDQAPLVVITGIEVEKNVHHEHHIDQKLKSEHKLPCWHFKANLEREYDSLVDNEDEEGQVPRSSDG